jgi:hypothetical protein
MKFWRPSLRIRVMGIWDPVTTTGLPKPGSRNERADEVYAMVSVPCRTTKPEWSARRSYRIRAIVHQSSGVAFAESMGGSSSRKEIGANSPPEFATIQSR